MNHQELKELWKQEEAIAHIHGWDFSHIADKYEEEHDIPWDYDSLVRQYLKKDMKLLDYDTGGGEFLLSLGHPYENTAATEGFPPNVKLCQEKLIPLGIDLKECSDPAKLPFEDSSFDLVINRHGDFCPEELYRVLKPGGLFITQQVGDRNDLDLVRMVFPDTEDPTSGLHLSVQQRAFEQAGFEIVRAEEHFGQIRFYDVGAFVWFARIIEWEFPGFSVDSCFDRLLQIQAQLEQKGSIDGTTHRYLIIARKPLD
jgi:SAM-dependent methyltransferase